MSDNVTYSNVPSGVPAGNVIATDSVDDTHFQRVKLDIGGDGVSVPVEDLATSANQQAAPTAAAIYNLTVVAGDTEYSQALPANTRRFSLQCLTDYDMRFAFATGKVATPTAPYALVRAGMNYYEEEVNLSSVTLYVASATAGVVAEIIAWS